MTDSESRTMLMTRLNIGWNAAASLLVAAREAGDEPTRIEELEQCADTLKAEIQRLAGVKP